MTAAVATAGAAAPARALAAATSGDAATPRLAAASPDAAGATRVGDESLVLRETPHPLPSATGGEPAWRDVFHHPGASYIAVHFAAFDLAPGERVVIAAPDGSFATTWVGRGKPLASGPFWATHVPGDTAVVTTYAGEAPAGFGYVVDSIAHGRPAPSAPAPSGFGTLSICGSDDSAWAKCYQTTEPAIYAQSRAIARLLVNGTLACTGWLVGCDGHLMTNNHCIGTQADANNTDYEFMAEGIDCAANCASFGACPGVVEASSGTLVKTDAARDYSLIHLPVNLSATYGFFRMRDGPAVVGERISLNGHPLGWGKRFAVASTHPSDTSGFCQVFGLSELACETGGPPDVGYYCDTQDGSSGSPVVATSDGKVVALHHCADCPNRGVPIQSIVADLRATNDLPACATQQFAGTVELDRTSYRCAGTAIVTVRDDSIAANSSQPVTVASTTETVPETVVLTASPAGSGIFTGAVALAALPPVHGDGKVSVADGGSLTVTYIDADDGAGGTNVPRTRTASIDCVTPLISTVGTSGISGTGAVLTWTTDEPATSEAHYGTSSPPASSASTSALVTSHALALAGLAPCTNYLFSVSSSDAAGNTAADDGGGSFHSFATVWNTAPVYASTGGPIPIPDNSTAGAVSTITITDWQTVLDLDVTVDVTHPFDADLTLKLLPPSGPPIVLAYRRGGGGANYTHTVFDDESSTPVSAGTAPFTGSYRPESPLGAVDGMTTAGAWSLQAIDAQGTDVGTLDGWSMRFTVAAGVCGPSLSYAGSAAADLCDGSGTSGGNGSVDPGETVAMALTLRNNGNVPLTNVSAILGTTTPGVTITRSAAMFPDIPPGQARTSLAPHPAISVGPSVACGALIDLTVAAGATQGSWTLPFTQRVGARTTSTSTYASTDVPKPIPDQGTAVSSLTIGNAQVLVDADVGVTLTHTFDGDLTLDLVAPDATTVSLANRRGGPGANFTGTIFDDEATASIGTGTAPFTGHFRPEQPLSVLDGKSAAGTWTLRVGDHGSGDSGTLTAWSLVATTISGWTCGACAPVPLEAASLGWQGGGKTELGWSAAPYATSYALYRGAREDLPALLTTAPDGCTRLLTSATSSGAGLLEAPAPGSLFWYLVAGRDASGEGTAGSATAGPRIVNSIGPCP